MSTHTSHEGATSRAVVERGAVRYPYEDISNVSGARALLDAEAIYRAGWTRRGYPTVVLQEGTPWALEGHERRTWNYQMHCWDMLDSLLRADSQGGDPKYLALAIEVALDWVTRHDPDASSDPAAHFAWYDMAVGLRAYRLAYILDAGVARSQLDGPPRVTLWTSLEAHQRYLADDAKIAFHSNHGFYQVAGQLAMGRRFAETSTLMADALDQGRARFARMLHSQFAADGVHLEHSPDYHRMVYDTLKSVLSAGLIEDSEVVERARLIEDALSWFVTPSRHIAAFGDSDHRSMLRKPPEAERKYVGDAMRFVVTDGALGTLPGRTLEAFPAGGYCIARKAPAHPGARLREYSYLAQSAAFHSRTHKHADDLSFIWSDRGNDLLVDAGRYGYVGKAEKDSALWLDGHWYSDPNRIYCESTRAHNTLEFDGRNYPRKGVKPYGSALTRWLEDESGLVAIETECRHFTSIRRARVLVFMPAQWLVVYDWFHDNAEQPHDVKQWFHLAPELQLHRGDAGYHAAVPGSMETLQVASLLAGPMASRLYLGETAPVMQGWWSPKERDIVPNYAFCYEQRGAASGVFATLFCFTSSLRADTGWSKVNTSGRKGQLRWRDDQGTHELRLERPSEKVPLVVEHRVSRSDGAGARKS